jgi:hypothetical protein
MYFTIHKGVFMTKHVITITTLSALLFSTASPVLAQSTAPWQQRQEQRVEKLEQAQEKVQERIEQRCTVLNQKVELTLTRYTNNLPRHKATYQSMQQKVEQLLAKAKAAGKDTAELEADLTVFRGKVQTYAGQVDAVMKQLEVTKQYNCGSSEGQFRAALIEARRLAQQAHQTGLDLRLYYQKEIRADLNTLKSRQ